MNHAPFPRLGSRYRCSGLIAAAAVSLSIVSGLFKLFAAVDAGHATIARAQHPAAPAPACVEAAPGEARCDAPAATVVSRVSALDDADTR